MLQTKSSHIYCPYYSLRNSPKYIHFCFMLDIDINICSCSWKKNNQFPNKAVHYYVSISLIFKAIVLWPVFLPCASLPRHIIIICIDKAIWDKAISCLITICGNQKLLNRSLEDLRLQNLFHHSRGYFLQATSLRTWILILLLFWYTVSLFM